MLVTSIFVLLPNFFLFFFKCWYAGNQHFLLFPQRFQTYNNTKIIILSTVNLSTANAFNLDQSKFLLFGKESKEVLVQSHVLNIVNSNFYCEDDKENNQSSRNSFCLGNRKPHRYH